MRSAHSSGSPTRRLRGVLPSVLALAVLVLTVSLGDWQVRRANEKAAIQAQHEAAQRDPPRRLSAGAAEVSGLDGRRVLVRGVYLADRTVFIDNRTRNGVAGFHVITPVRIQDTDRYVLVMRGWVPRDPRERTRLPVLSPPPGVVDVEGLAQTSIAKVLELRAAPRPGPEDRLWQNLDFETFRSWSGLDLLPLLVRDTAPSADGLIRELPAVADDVAKHKGYAFQWYAMALATAALWVYYLFFFRRRERSANSN